MAAEDHNLWCLPDEQRIPFESGSSHDFFFMTSKGVFHATVASGLLIRDK